jgi:membrane-associated phospholipid phosphatase
MLFTPARGGPEFKSINTFRLFRSWNATDRMLSGWYVLLTMALVAYDRANSASYIGLHLVIVTAIVALSTFSNHGGWWRFAHNWYPTLVFVATFEETSRLSLAFAPHWQDALILRAEAAVFATAPTVWLARIHTFWITELVEFGYFTFYWIMFVVGGFLYEHIWKAKSPREANDPKQPFRIWMDATVLGYIICYVVYLLLPTEGPAHTLPHQSSAAFAGPFHWLVQLIQHHAGVHGNAFPSGHIMASFVALLAAAKWKPRLARWLTVPVLLMCVGAVYDRYHYASDIFAGAILGAIVFWLVHSIRSAPVTDVG